MANRYVADHWPSVSVPGQRPDCQLAGATGAAVIEVKTQPVLVGFAEYAGMTGTDHIAFRRKKEGASIVHHVLTALIEVRARHLRAPSNTDVIGAVGAPATASPVDEEEVLLVVIVDVGCFDGVIRRYPAAGIKDPVLAAVFNNRRGIMSTDTNGTKLRLCGREREQNDRTCRRETPDVSQCASPSDSAQFCRTRSNRNRFRAEFVLNLFARISHHADRDAGLQHAFLQPSKLHSRRRREHDIQ